MSSGHALAPQRPRPLEMLRLAGSPRELGRQHGEACRELLHAWRDDHFFRIARLAPGSPDREHLRAAAWRHHAHIAAACPELVEEIEGLAEGAALPYADALACQLRRELVGYSRLAPRGDCSLAALPGPHAFLAQTVDLAGDLAEFAQVLHIRPREGAPMLVFSFAGLLGYLGLNAHGLAIGINLVLGGHWGPGVPAYLLVRQLLRCASVDEALAQLQATPHASSRALTLMDARRLVTVEFTPTSSQVIEADAALVHTNHFLHPQMRAAEAINVFALSGSRRRLEALERRLPLLDAQAPCTQLIERLFAHDTGNGQRAAELCVHADAGLHHETTAAAVCLRPREGQLAACRGAPCTGTVQTFSLS